MRSYEDALRYMYSLQRFGIKFGLRNIALVLKELGEPQKGFHSIIVAGTNGKGATASFLESMLREHGLSTGLFTSPHLVRFTERIKLNGAEIARDDVVRYACVVRDAVDELNAGRDERKRINITFFEFITAMAARYFADAGADVCIFEVGMGGRLDATNAMGAEIAVIVTVSLEHTNFLGDTIERIAREKAGVIKPRGAVVIGQIEDAARREIARVADRLQAELFEYGRHFRFKSGDMRTYSGLGRSFEIDRLGLTGSHQWINAACAVCAAELAEREGWLGLDADAVRRGLANAKLDGRLQLIDGERTYLLDGAHNPQAMRTLVECVARLDRGQPSVVVFGISTDKDIDGVMDNLAQIEPAHLILTRANSPLAADPLMLADRAHGRFTYISIADDVPQALALAKRYCGNGKLIVITGSFYVVGEAIRELVPKVEADPHIPWGRG